MPETAGKCHSCGFGVSVYINDDLSEDSLSTELDAAMAYVEAVVIGAALAAVRIVGRAVVGVIPDGSTTGHLLLHRFTLHLLGVLSRDVGTTTP